MLLRRPPPLMAVIRSQLASPVGCQRRHASYTWLLGGKLATAMSTITPDAFVAVMLAGAAGRVLTLYFSFACERIAARYACALPELHAAAAEYEKIASAPYVLKIEHDMALKKLMRDRTRILKNHGGVLEHMLFFSLVSPTLLALWAAGPVKAMLAQMPAAASTAVGPTAPCPLELDVMGAAVVDPSFLLLGVSASINIATATWAWMGITDNGDAMIIARRNSYIGAIMGAALAATAVGTAGGAATLCGPTTVAWANWLQPLVPFSLGVSLTTLVLKQPLLHFTPFRLIFDIPERPATHGSYGNKPSGFRAEVHRAYEDIRGEMTEERYDSHLDELEKECDRQIRKGLDKYLGILGSEEVYWSAREENERRLELVRQQKQKQADSGR